MLIKIAHQPQEIADCFNAFLELYPALKNAENFINKIALQQKEGYQIASCVINDEVTSCLGFRFLQTISWGKILYINDLITKEAHRGLGYGKLLLKYIKQLAKENACQQIHLDTGYTAYTAHKVYLSEGFKLNFHHLVYDVKV